MNRSLEIAVADDEELMLFYFAEVLAELGHKVIIQAETGRKLVEACRSSPPDLVISDIKMPDMDGISAAQKLYEDRPVPIIVVSAYHEQDLIERVEASPVMTCLTKPIRQDDLKIAIALAMRRFGQFKTLAEEAADSHQALEDRKIIERAKGLLMKRARIDGDAAFRHLQKLAIDRKEKLVVIADMILAADGASGPTENEC